MARTKQTARKCSGGGSRYRRQPPPPVPSDTRPTGKAYLEVLRQLAEQSQTPIASEQVAAVVAEVTEQSISDARTALPDLGPDLLQRIFAKVGPHPKDLVPLGAVSKQWRKVLNESTWKELCLEHAGGLVEELGYGHRGDGPPGGWAGLYKLLVYCPGCHFPTFEHVLQADALSEKYDWRHGRGHVEGIMKGFCKGKEAKGALYLATPDDIVMSRLCPHDQAVEMCDREHEASAPPILACRGFVKHFASSKLAKLSGAAALLNQTQRSEAEGLASGPAESLGKQSDMLEATVAPDLGVVGGKLRDDEDLNEDDAPSKDDSEGYPSGSEFEVEGETDSEGEASAELKEPKEKGPPCVYCGSPTFALPRRAFGSQFSDYEELKSEWFCKVYDRHECGRSEDDSDASDDEPDESEFVLGTGFVCLSGHIVLGMAGYPELVESTVPQSGESLEPQHPQAVDFLLTYLVGDRGCGHKEGHQFIQGLEFDQLIQIEARLVQLKRVWPLEDYEGSDRHKVFGHIYGMRNLPVGIVDVLGADVPADLSKPLQDFVLTGTPSLAECERSILEAFESLERKRDEERARKVRRGAVDEALREAGLKYPFWQHLPNDLSETLKAFVETGNPSLAECNRQILGERETIKQQEERTKVLELRTKTIHEALRQAGFDPRSAAYHPNAVPHQQSLRAYVEVSSVATHYLALVTEELRDPCCLCLLIAACLICNPSPSFFGFELLASREVVALLSQHLEVPSWNQGVEWFCLMVAALVMTYEYVIEVFH